MHFFCVMCGPTGADDDFWTNGVDLLVALGLEGRPSSEDVLLLFMDIEALERQPAKKEKS